MAKKDKSKKRSIDKDALKLVSEINNTMGKKPIIAVVGAGIFGITTALKLAEAGYNVDLFERYNDILRAASDINQYRLHSGYHYPRSPETVLACKNANESFVSVFSDAVITNPEQYYCIAKHDSKVSGQEYISFCKSQGLEYKLTVPEVIKADSVDIGISANETRWDPRILYQLCWQKLRTSSVNVLLGIKATRDIIKGYDFFVIAAYANVNDLIDPEAQCNYLFELCEKPVIKLPEKYKDKGFVIMDGPFVSIDPIGKSPSDLHVMGSVVHAIHHANIGFSPERYPDLESYLNRGVIKEPRISNFPRFIETASQFFKDIEQTVHIGSMYTYRAVLSGVDDTDERPTIVEKVGDNAVKLFSGKITTCVIAAQQVLEIIDREKS